MFMFIRFQSLNDVSAFSFKVLSVLKMLVGTKIEVTQGGNQTLLCYPEIVSLKDGIHASMTLYMIVLHCKFALVFQISTAHGGVCY